MDEEDFALFTDSVERCSEDDKAGFQNFAVTRRCTRQLNSGPSAVRRIAGPADVDDVLLGTPQTRE
jgi:hypothetical protein